MWAYVLVLTASLAIATTAATRVVVTNPFGRTLQVLEAGSSSGELVGGKLTLPSSIGNISYSAVAGSYAFTAGGVYRTEGGVTTTLASTLAVVNIIGKAPRVITNVKFRGLTSGFFEGCALDATSGRMAAQRVAGGAYELYVVIECWNPTSTRDQGSWVAVYTYLPSQKRLSGPSSNRRYILWEAGAYNLYPVEVHALAVLGSTVYAVITEDVGERRPALHALDANTAVPPWASGKRGIVAALPPPHEDDDYFDGDCAVSSPTSFYAVYRDVRCWEPGPTSRPCVRTNTREMVLKVSKGKGTLRVGSTSMVSTWNPDRLAFSLSKKVLFKLKSSPSAYDRGAIQRATLTARADASAAHVGFKEARRLPWTTSSSANYRTLQINAL